MLKIIAVLALLMMTGLSQAQQGLSVKRYIPENAKKYIPVLDNELLRLWPEMPYPHYFGALIEQESCISLKHKKCWDPRAELKTSRELGVGFGQLTKAYRADGSVRFDTIADLNRKYKQELKDLAWSNVYQRPDLQIRAMTLLYKENYTALREVKNPWQRLAMADAAYNGGLSGLRKDRLQCSLTQGCSAQTWFGNVELTCMKSKKPIYGNRSACDINREHVQLTLEVRLDKYKDLF